MLWLYVGSFFAALLLSIVFVPISAGLAKLTGAMDFPDRRKVHRDPMPRWGGLGIALAFFAAIGIITHFSKNFQTLLAFETQISGAGGHVHTYALKQVFWGTLLGGCASLLLGLWDDKKRIGASVKFPFQIVAAYVAMDYGLRLSGIELPFVHTYWEFPLIVSQMVTVFWLIGFMNTINLADGLDGLAAGVSAIAAGTFGVLSMIGQINASSLLSHQMQLAGVFASTLAGSCVGFLWFNFYPARIFMGDGGALFLGFMLGAIAVLGTFKRAAIFSFLIPISVVALPVVDVLFAILRRWRRGQEIFSPDKDHFHHRMLSRGWTHREVVLLVYVITLILAVIAIVSGVFKLRG